MQTSENHVFADEWLAAGAPLLDAAVPHYQKYTPISVQILLQRRRRAVTLETSCRPVTRWDMATTRNCSPQGGRLDDCEACEYWLKVNRYVSHHYRHQERHETRPRRRLCFFNDDMQEDVLPCRRERDDVQPGAFSKEYIYVHTSARAAVVNLDYGSS